MGNENKINDLIRLSKDNFLPDEVRDTTPASPEYSVEDEIVKAKKNRDGKFYLVITSFLAIVIGGAYLGTSFVQKSYMETTIGFGDFDELNLQEMLTSTRQEERALNLAKEKLSAVEIERQTKIDEVRADYAEKIDNIYAQELPAAETKPLVDDLKLAREKEIEEVEKDFAGSIASEESNVAKREAELEAKREKLEEEVNKAESIVNNYKRLQQMQIRKLKDEHNREMANLILRYNPYFKQTELRQIIKEVKSEKTIEQPTLFDYRQSLYHIGILTEGEFENLRAKLTEYESLMDRLQQIPYKNHVAPSLDAMQNSGYFMISQYERLVNQLAIMVEQYHTAFEHITEKSPDSGIVIDAGNQLDVLVSMKAMVDIEEGDRGLIFRNSDEFIGTLVFEMRYGKLVASVLELTPGQSIQPFDKIYMQKKVMFEEPEIAPPGSETPENVPGEPGVMNEEINGETAPASEEIRTEDALNPENENTGAANEMPANSAPVGTDQTDQGQPDQPKTSDTPAGPANDDPDENP